jgi:hypothetical protein
MTLRLNLFLLDERFALAYERVPVCGGPHAPTRTRTFYGHSPCVDFFNG